MPVGESFGDEHGEESFVFAGGGGAVGDGDVVVAHGAAESGAEEEGVEGAGVVVGVGEEPGGVVAAAGEAGEDGGGFAGLAALVGEVEGFAGGVVVAEDVGAGEQEVEAGASGAELFGALFELVEVVFGGGGVAVGVGAVGEFGVDGFGAEGVAVVFGGAEAVVEVLVGFVVFAEGAVGLGFGVVEEVWEGAGASGVDEVAGAAELAVVDVDAGGGEVEHGPAEGAGAVLVGGHGAAGGVEGSGPVAAHVFDEEAVGVGELVGVDAVVVEVLFGGLEFAEGE